MTGPESAPSPAWLRTRKGGLPVVAVTAHCARMAALAERYVDMILVGDSLAMTVYGAGSTQTVDMDTMIRHAAAVTTAARRAIVVVDMPRGSYEDGPEQALTNARTIMDRSGCHAVKLEGGHALAPTIATLVANGCPVIGHVGLLPQSVPEGATMRVQGKSPAEADRLVADALAIAQAGADAIVVEATVEPVARRLSGSIPVPTIGIGASLACDGQILVIDDLLGLTPKPPRFVQRYADLSTVIDTALHAYARDVRTRRFPGPDHVYHHSQGEPTPQQRAHDSQSTQLDMIAGDPDTA